MNRNDFDKLFPQGLSRLPKYKPRPLYPFEKRALQVLLRNPLLEQDLKNEFGKRPLNDTEIRALKVLHRNYKDRPQEIEDIFESTLHQIISPNKTNVQIIAPEESTIQIESIYKELTFQEQKDRRSKLSSLIDHQSSNISYLKGRLQEDDNQERQDNEAEGLGYVCEYDQHCDRGNREGYIDIKRFWFYSTIGQIDKTSNLVLSYAQYYRNYLYNSPYYFLPKTSFFEVVTDLSPEVSERQYGRVYFHTETRYHYFCTPTYKGKTIRGYSIINNRRVYHDPSEYKKPNRLYKENQDGSILKRYTTQGLYVTRFFNYIETIRSADYNIPIRNILFTTFEGRHYRHPPGPERDYPEGPPNGPSKEGLVRSVLYSKIYELLTTNTNCSDWFYDPKRFNKNYWSEYNRCSHLPDTVRRHAQITHLEPSSTLRISFLEKYSHEEDILLKNYNRSERLNQEIQKVLITNFTNRIAVKRIEQAYRDYKTRQLQFPYQINNITYTYTPRFINKRRRIDLDIY